MTATYSGTRVGEISVMRGAQLAGSTHGGGPQLAQATGIGDESGRGLPVHESTCKTRKINGTAKQQTAGIVVAGGHGAASLQQGNNFVTARGNGDGGAVRSIGVALNGFSVSCSLSSASGNSANIRESRPRSFNNGESQP
ncbi:hypothetical protein NL676_013080 [Syzygium grande]|nr:hypothetical protein NL676_013080 [Syzygium grande]